MKIKRRLALVAWLLSAALVASAADKTAAPRKAKKAPRKPAVATAPTQANVPYGEHPRQVLDLYKAPSDRPTPVVFYIHGGGWMAGDKAGAAASVPELFAAGISVVAINYRYVSQAQEAGVTPPVKAPLEDAARALQFVRSKAAEWGLDKKRIGATGGSAGACSSLWLALHDDMADPQSSDPVARESTRLACAAVLGAQTSLDPKQMRDWIVNSRYGGHAFGFRTSGAASADEFERFYQNREKILPWIREYSPAEWVSADDPPLMLYYSAPPAAAGQPEKDPTHSAIFGQKLCQIVHKTGGECHLVYPGAPDAKYESANQFLVERLKSKP